MLPLIGVGPDASGVPALPLRRVSIVLGAHGVQPSIGGEGAITTRSEFQDAVKRAQFAVNATEGDFIAALVASVNQHTFRALAIYKHRGELRLYDSTLNSHTLEVLNAKPLIKGVDFKYTWHGVLGFGGMWFEIEKPTDTTAPDATNIQTMHGKSLRLSTDVVDALGEKFAETRGVVDVA